LVAATLSTIFIEHIGKKNWTNTMSLDIVDVAFVYGRYQVVCWAGRAAGRSEAKKGEWK
jgi:hypothetical protein